MGSQVESKDGKVGFVETDRHESSVDEEKLVILEQTAATMAEMLENNLRRYTFYYPESKREDAFGAVVGVYERFIRLRNMYLELQEDESKTPKAPTRIRFPNSRPVADSRQDDRFLRDQLGSKRQAYEEQSVAFWKQVSSMPMWMDIRRASTIKDFDQIVTTTGEFAVFNREFEGRVLEIQERWKNPDELAIEGKLDSYQSWMRHKVGERIVM